MIVLIELSNGQCREIEHRSFGYDDNSNINSNTPPGKPAHTFTHTPIDNIATYIPPDLGFGATDTIYDFNLDRQLSRSPDRMGWRSSFDL